MDGVFPVAEIRGEQPTLRVLLVRALVMRRVAPSPAHVPLRTVLGALVLAAAANAWSAEPGMSRRMTREELVRTWDLDRNGTIDEGEAAVAASRMRQERARMRLRNSLDPVTGRLLDDLTDDEAAGAPLIEDGPASPGPQSPPWDGAEAAPERSPAHDWFDRWSLDDTRAEPSATRPSRPAAPSLHGPIPGRLATPSTGAGSAVAARRAEPGPAAQPAGDAGDATATARRPWATGGLRAGADPARPGYGSGVRRDLNAGRPIDRTAGPAAGRRASPDTPAPGAVAPGGATPRRAPTGGRTPGRPYDPF